MKPWKQLSSFYLRWKRKQGLTTPGVFVTEVESLLVPLPNSKSVIISSVRGKGPNQTPVRIRSRWHFKAYMAGREIVRITKSGHRIHFDPVRGPYWVEGPGWWGKDKFDYASIEMRIVERMGGTPKTIGDVYG